MRKLNKKGGFTLAELLIVVAIIAVLVAIAIPVFAGQLDKAKVATATANLRSAYAEYVANCLADGENPSHTGFESSSPYTSADLQGATPSYDSGKYTITIGSATGEVPIASGF